MPLYLALADAVFDLGAAPVAQLQGGDVIVVLVGEQACVPVGVLVEDLNLRAGVRSLPPTSSREPSGHADRSRWSVSSATQALSRSSPSAAIACNQADPGNPRIAWRTVSGELVGPGPASTTWWFGSRGAGASFGAARVIALQPGLQAVEAEAVSATIALVPLSDEGPGARFDDLARLEFLAVSGWSVVRR